MAEAGLPESLETSLSVLLRVERLVLRLMLEARLRLVLLSVVRLEDLRTFSRSKGKVF